MMPASRDEADFGDFGATPVVWGDAGFGLLGLGKVVDFAMGKTGGKKVAAKSLGVKEKDVKITVTPKQLVSSVAKTVAVSASAAALLVPGLNVAVGGAVAGSAVGADRLIAASQTVGKAADDAKRVIATTKQLAAQGNADAQRGLKVIEQVTAERAKKGIPPGKVQPVTAAGEAAFNAFKQVVSKLPGVKVKAPSSAPALAPAGKTAAAKKAIAARARVQQAKQKQLADALAGAGLKKAAASASAPKPGGKLMASLDLAKAKVRFTVTDAGRVVRGLAPDRGWVVYETGRVQRQA